MSSAVILQHVSQFGPGRIVPLLRDYGIPVQVRRLYQGDEVPTDLEEMRMLIILGGPMHVADLEGGKFPFLQKEMDLLHRIIAADRPTLGIGLGAQLLAHAAGAKVYPNARPGPTPADPTTPMPELGWAPVNFPFPGGTEPIVMGLNDGAMMFHWHFDTFDLPRLPAPPNHPAPPAPPAPAGNALLSSTKACKNQAFRFKNRLFGFQYHFEFTERDIEAVLTAGKEDLTKALGAMSDKAIRDATPKHFARYTRLGDKIIQNFVQFLKVY